MSVSTAAISTVDHFYTFALEAIRQGNYDYAIRKLRFGIQRYPQYIKLHSLLSQAYFDTGELDLAQSHANTAFKLDRAKEFTPILDEDF